MISITVNAASVTELHQILRSMLPEETINVEVVGTQLELPLREEIVETVIKAQAKAPATVETSAPVKEKKTRAKKEKIEKEPEQKAVDTMPVPKAPPVAPSLNDEFSSPAPTVLEEKPAATLKETPIAPPTPKLGKDSVQQAIQQVNVAVGLHKAREVLDAFGVRRPAEVKEAHFARFVELCNLAVKDPQAVIPSQVPAQA